MFLLQPNYRHFSCHEPVFGSVGEKIAGLGAMSRQKHGEDGETLGVQGLAQTFGLIGAVGQSMKHQQSFAGIAPPIKRSRSVEAFFEGKGLGEFCRMRRKIAR